jgi:hypothetical protein
MQAHRIPDRREHDRVSLGGSAMLITDPGREPISTSGHLINVSRGGCQLRLQRRVEPHREAQVRLELAGDMQWFPIIISWVRQDPDGWIVGCVFEPLGSTLQDALRKVMLELTLT